MYHNHNCGFFTGEKYCYFYDRNYFKLNVRKIQCNNKELEVLTNLSGNKSLRRATHDYDMICV